MSEHEMDRQIIYIITGAPPRQKRALYKLLAFIRAMRSWAGAIDETGTAMWHAADSMNEFSRQLKEAMKDDPAARAR